MPDASEPRPSLRTLAGRSLSGVDRTVRTLERLHPHAIRDGAEIRVLLERAAREGIELRRGMNRRIDQELAWITGIGDTSVDLRTR